MIKISQSFIKEWLKYLQGEVCGHKVKAQFIDRNYPATEATPAMALGNYFQFVSAGLMPKDGVIPEPEFYKKATGDNKPGDVKPEYKLLNAHAVTFKMWMVEMGYKIDSVNRYIESGNYSGELDIDCIGNLIIDLKCSGFIGNYWEKFGWSERRFREAVAMLSERGDMDAALAHCPHLIQALHYCMLAGKDQFIFYVVNPKNEFDVFVIHLDLKDYVEMYRGWLEVQTEMILTATFERDPHLGNCGTCQLGCKSLLPKTVKL